MVPHDLACERAPLPVPGAYPRVALRYEPSGPDSHQALAVGGTLGTDGRGRSLSDAGTHRPGPRRVLEELPTPLSWVKASVYRSMIQLSSTACASSAWTNTYGATPRIRTGTSLSL